MASSYGFILSARFFNVQTKNVVVLGILNALFPPGDLREIIIYPLSPLPLELIKGEIIFGDYGIRKYHPSLGIIDASRDNFNRDRLGFLRNVQS